LVELIAAIDIDHRMGLEDLMGRQERRIGHPGRIAGAGKDHAVAEIGRLRFIFHPAHKFAAGRYKPQETGGGEISNEEYLKLHTDLLNRDQWIIDGFDTVALAWERFSAADTLVYIDLPLVTHYMWVTSLSVKSISQPS